MVCFMEAKTSAHYQRLHRQRLREQGLVKKEVWILPEHSAALHQLEKQMRLPQAGDRAGLETALGADARQADLGQHVAGQVADVRAQAGEDALQREAENYKDDARHE